MLIATMNGLKWRRENTRTTRSIMTIVRSLAVWTLAWMGTVVNLRVECQYLPEIEYHDDIWNPWSPGELGHGGSDNARTIYGESLPCDRYETAGGYFCRSTSLEALLALNDMDGQKNWATSGLTTWSDPDREKNYALVGLEDRTVFVDVTAPNFPVYVGFLKSHDDRHGPTRSIATNGYYAYITVERSLHGLQIFDLRGLRGVTTPTKFTESGHSSLVAGNSILVSPEIPPALARGIFINKKSNYGYVYGSPNCMGGPFMINLVIPLLPTTAGCISYDGYAYDVQCVIYEGPDTEFRDKEICISATGDGFTVVDVTVKSAPSPISRLNNLAHPFRAITTGVLTENHRFYIFADAGTTPVTTTYVVDLTILTKPYLLDKHEAYYSALVGPQVVMSKYLVQAHHASGVRILDMSALYDDQPKRPVLVEIGYLDTTREIEFLDTEGNAGTNGARTVVPWWGGSVGKVLVNSRSEGLFIVGIEDYVLSPSTAPSRSVVPTVVPSVLASSAPSVTSNPSATTRPTTQPSVSKSPAATLRPSRLFVFGTFGGGILEPSSPPTDLPYGAILEAIFGADALNNNQLLRDIIAVTEFALDWILPQLVSLGLPYLTQIGQGLYHLVSFSIFSEWGGPPWEGLLPVPFTPIEFDKAAQGQEDDDDNDDNNDNDYEYNPPPARPIDESEST